MRTVKQILDAKAMTALQKQLVLGFCKDAKVRNEQQLNLRKIKNRQVFNQCVSILNKNNKIEPTEECPEPKPYINVVDDVNDIKDEHDIYIVSTTFGMKFYMLKTDKVGSPTMKLTVMLSTRLNTVESCWIHQGTHKNHHLFFTGLLLQYPAHKYYKVNDYDTITKHYNGYKAT